MKTSQNTRHHDSDTILKKKCNRQEHNQLRKRRSCSTYGPVDKMARGGGGLPGQTVSPSSSGPFLFPSFDTSLLPRTLINTNAHRIYQNVHFNTRSLARTAIQTPEQFFLVLRHQLHSFPTFSSCHCTALLTHFPPHTPSQASPIAHNGG